MLEASANRQSIADLPRARKDRLHHPKAVLRHWTRLALYAFPPVRRLLERETPSPAKAKAYWDEAMSQTAMSTYLGGTITVDATNAMTATMVKYHAPLKPAILDVGCAGGTLAHALPPYREYFGIDVSSHAIELAMSASYDSKKVSFEAVDIRDFDPGRGAWDVIVFNEVLYYLTQSEAAIEQVRRYVKALTSEGILVISMKNDAKSRVIFGMLGKEFEWVDGMLWQQKQIAPKFSIGINRECPACMVAVLRGKQQR